VFAEETDRAIARARRGAESFAVLYLDLDHFKDVNDTLGHPVGDALLKEVGVRLRAAAREGDTVARFGGDEFAVLQAGIRDPADPGMLAERLRSVLAAPYSVNGNEIMCGASIGIAVYGTDAQDSETLLARADVALYRAKAEGRGTYRFFTAAMDVEVRTRVSLANDLRRALGSGELFLEYQLQVDAAGFRIVGVEALARWRHPTMGLIPPSVFIPVAEGNGLIGAVEEWAMEEACRQFKDWRDKGIALPRLAVNISAARFKPGANLVEAIDRVRRQYGIPSGQLEFELTESVLMEASQHHADVLLELRARGVLIAIDDFGTGYSSLDYLRRYPVDRIKIAQNFVLELGSKAENAAIVRASIGLAHELGIPILAEGVENDVQLGLLVGWGCNELQGFYFAKPMRGADLEALLRAGHAEKRQGRLA